eukprot:jgi/Chrpa1/7405/Chrysochromulina_OHIO_Genome00013104-RA
MRHTPSKGARFLLDGHRQAGGKARAGTRMKRHEEKDLELALAMSASEQEQIEQRDRLAAAAREDDNPITLFIDSARERVGSLFGITPLVMEREGATTENAPASKPTPQPPPSPAKPAPKPPPKHTEPWACSACTLINAPHRSTCRACETAAPPPPSIDQPVGNGRVPPFQPPLPQPPVQRFKLNERVECRDRGQSWQVGTVVSVAPLEVRPDGATWWTAGHAWDEVRVLPPPPGLKLEGGSLTGDRAKYLGKFLFVDGKLVNGRPAWQHTVDASLWLAFDGTCWMGQVESKLGQGRGDLQLSDAAAASPDASSATWQAWTGTAWAAQPQLKCIPWTPPPPRGLKLEGGSLPGDAAKYKGEYRLYGSKLINDRSVWQHTAHLTCWIAFDGANWRGQPESDLGQRWGLLLLPDAAAARPNASSATWLAAKVPGAAGAAQPQLKCIPWTPPPPPRLKLEGSSLPGAAAEYMGFYMLDGNKRVNGRPSWKHMNGRCWVAFDGADWRGQPEADLGQKRGVLMLTDEDAASPDASSATWQAWTGSAWVAQPTLKCTVTTAAERSAAQAAAALRAKKERRARAAAAREASVQAVRSSAGSCLSCIFGFFTPDDGQVKHFRGPSADCCKPLARCCCVSADGEAIFGCVPTEPNYNLPFGLHMALCPQLGCDPKGGLSFE